jgi:hypothetical protein
MPHKPITSKETMTPEEIGAATGRIDALVNVLGEGLRASPTDIIEDITALLYMAAVAGKSKDVPTIVLVQMFMSLLEAPRTNESVARIQTAAAIDKMREVANGQ